LLFTISQDIPKTPTIACFAPPSFGSSYGTFFDGFGMSFGTVGRLSQKYWFSKQKQKELSRDLLSYLHFKKRQVPIELVRLTPYTTAKPTNTAQGKQEAAWFCRKFNQWTKLPIDFSVFQILDTIILREHKIVPRLTKFR